MNDGLRLAFCRSRLGFFAAKNGRDGDTRAAMYGRDGDDD